MLMHAIVHGGCAARESRQSALEVVCGREKNLPHGGLEPASVLRLAFQWDARFANWAICLWWPDESIATNAIAARKMLWQWWPDKEQCHKHGLCDRVILGSQYLQCCQRHRCLYDGVIRRAKEQRHEHQRCRNCASLWCWVAPQTQRRQRQRSMCEFVMLCGSTITAPQTSAQHVWVCVAPQWQLQRHQRQHSMCEFVWLHSHSYSAISVSTACVSLCGSTVTATAPSASAQLVWVCVAPQWQLQRHQRQHSLCEFVWLHSHSYSAISVSTACVSLCGSTVTATAPSASAQLVWVCVAPQSQLQRHQRQHSMCEFVWLHSHSYSAISVSTACVSLCGSTVTATAPSASAQHVWVCVAPQWQLQRHQRQHSLCDNWCWQTQRGLSRRRRCGILARYFHLAVPGG